MPDYTIAMQGQQYPRADFATETGKAYTLADMENKYKDDQENRADAAFMQEQLKQGANLETPEGIADYIQSAKGKISPRNYAALIDVHNNMEAHVAQLQSTYANLEPAQMNNILQRGEAFSKLAEPAVTEYEQALENIRKTGGEAAAETAKPGLQAKYKAQAAAIAPQLGQVAGMKPEQLQQYTGMSPEQMRSKIKTSTWQSDLMKKAAETRRLEAQADQASMGKDAVELQTLQDQLDDPNTPEIRKPAIREMIKKLTTFKPGAAGALQGRDPATIPQEERKLAVYQWIQNPSSLRGLEKSVQQNVMKWASDMGIAPEDVITGRAEMKFKSTEASAAGHRAGVLNTVERAIPGLVAQAKHASNLVDRGDWVPINKLMQMADSALSDPNLRKLKLANQALASEFQLVISRGGSNVTSLKAAMDLLQTADGPDAYNAALKQLQKEVEINVKASKSVAKEIGGDTLGKIDAYGQPKATGGDKTSPSAQSSKPRVSIVTPTDFATSEDSQRKFLKDVKAAVTSGAISQDQAKAVIHDAYASGKPKMAPAAHTANPAMPAGPAVTPQSVAPTGVTPQTTAPVAAPLRTTPAPAAPHVIPQTATSGSIRPAVAPQTAPPTARKLSPSTTRPAAPMDPEIVVKEVPLRFTTEGGVGRILDIGSKEELMWAVKSGKLKPGQKFMGPYNSVHIFHSLKESGFK